jgi:hypothetical protein
MSDTQTDVDSSTGGTLKRGIEDVTATDGGGKKKRLTETEREERVREKEVREKEKEARDKERAVKVCVFLILRGSGL